MTKQKKTTKATKTRARTKATKQPTTAEDFKTAALLVSGTINVAIFVGWLAVQLTTKYDYQVALLIFGR
jgi:F0F1-type ATP synthase assembly protein I